MFPSAMPFSTECNTSPVSALLRVMAMRDKSDISTVVKSNAIDNLSVTVSNDTSQEAQLNARQMLKPIDEWMSRLDESQTSLILRRSKLVTSTGLAATKDDDDEEASQIGSSVKELLGSYSRSSLEEENPYNLEVYRFKTAAKCFHPTFQIMMTNLLRIRITISCRRHRQR
jgi:hypothetical protein